MSKIWVGCALLLPRRNLPPLVYARVIFIDEVRDMIVIAVLPETNSKGGTHHYIKKPKLKRLSAVERQVSTNEFYVADFETPSHWLLTMSQLRSGSTAGLLRKTRRNTRTWLRIQLNSYRIIRPFVKNRTLAEILFDTEFSAWPGKRAAELGNCTTAQVQRSLNAYLLALGSINGLLPWFANSGAPGKPKFSTTKTGRPREASKRGAHSGKNCPERVRKIFELGWKKFKKAGVSVSVAFSRTKLEWFAKSVIWNGSSASVTLTKEASHYTEEQFEYWGTKSENALSAAQIERGETNAKREYLRRQNKSKDKYRTLNGEAFLDSTSCDQTLVSEASRLKVLSSPWRTEVMGSYIDYIFGHHVGFEDVSSTTALMAINHAAHPKIEYCARFGIEIENRDWLPMSFGRFSLDNGEGKTELVMRTFEELECGAIYGAAYDAINKSIQESSHKRAHLKLDHLLPGSTLGRRARRGEPSRAEMALLNFSEYLPMDIKRILHHNNEEIINLPLIEMRQDDIEPTRRGVVEWLMANGRMSSAAVDLSILKVHCLPRLKAYIDAGVVRIYDPIFSGKRIIPELAYVNDWFLRTAAANLSGKRRHYIEVHINPSDLTQCWCNLGDRLQHLTLRSADPDLAKMTLIDWLTVCADDRLKLFLSKVTNAAHAVNREAAIKKAASDAKRERTSEIKSLPKKPTKAQLKRDIRGNTAVEKSAQTGIPRAPQSVLPEEFSTRPDPTFPPWQISSTQFEDDMEDIMREIREN